MSDRLVLAKVMVEEEMSSAQALFLSSYLSCWSARRAAVVAGYKADQGNVVLASLAEVLRGRLGEDYMTDEELEMRLVDIARGVGGEYIDNFGFINFQKLKADNKTHLIKSIQRNRDGINIIFYDSQRALEIIGKTRGVVHGDVKRHLHGHVGIVDEAELDKAIDKIYRQKVESGEVIDGEFESK